MLRKLVFLLAASTIASPALAQHNPYGGGTRLEPAPETVIWPTDETRPVLADFGECTVKRAHDLAREMILQSTSTDIGPHYITMFTSQCFGTALIKNGVNASTLQFSGWRARTMVASALIKKDLANFDANDIRTAGPLVRLTLAATPLKAGDTQAKESRARDAQSLAFDPFSECVVRADPLGAQTLLRTKINSNEEWLAIRALLPTLGGCVDRGQQVRSDRESLRGAVAFNFYRLAYAPRVAATNAGVTQ